MINVNTIGNSTHDEKEFEVRKQTLKTKSTNLKPKPIANQTTNNLTDSKLTPDAINKVVMKKPQIKNNKGLESIIGSDKSENKPILSFNDLLKAALEVDKGGLNDLQYTLPKTTLEGKAKTKRRFRFSPLLPQIMEYIIGSGGGATTLFFKHTDFKVSKRRFDRAVQKLVNLRWLVRTQRGANVLYWIHPFLHVLIDRWEQSAILAIFSGLKISLEDCLNLPLYNALKSGKKIASIESRFDKYQHGDYIGYVMKMLEGHVAISGKFADGTQFNSLLWVNLHAGSRLLGKAESGYKGKGKGKPICDYKGNLHHTLPLRWSLWGIQEVKEYNSKSGKAEFIHYDHSLKVIHYKEPNSKVTFPSLLDNTLESKWSSKNCEYTEVSSFEVLQQLLNKRFVEGKTAADLMDAMNMKTSEKPNGRPRGIKNKPKPKFRAPTEADLAKLFEKEIRAKIRSK
jgi:hypothetical protein